LQSAEASVADWFAEASEAAALPLPEGAAAAAGAGAVAGALLAPLPRVSATPPCFEQAPLADLAVEYVPSPHLNVAPAGAAAVVFVFAVEVVGFAAALDESLARAWATPP
jgi:hypothetical protein